MIKLTMPTYHVTLTNNSLDTLNTLIQEVYNGKKLFIITDKTVFKLYSDLINQVLSTYTKDYMIINPGEQSKSLKTYHRAIKNLISKGIKRDHFILALGGGVVGDLTGFIASSLYRGVPYAQIPTTLLSQVDSSIGSKVAIDLKEGKNLIGAFYDPSFVFVDTLFLETLSKREYMNGLAEMIKASLINSPDLFNKISTTKQVDAAMIHEALTIKQAFVLKDPFDKNERMILNFGHTFGHAIEKKHHYRRYKHGEAISYGMLMALEVGIKLGITRPSLYETLLTLLLDKGLVQEPLLKKEDYIDAIIHDKKVFEDGIRFILLESIGHPLIKTLKIEALL